MLIPPFLALLAQTPTLRAGDAPPARIAAETSHARDFAWAAAVDRHGVTDMKALRDGEARRAPERDAPGSRAYRVGGIVVTVDARSGLVTSVTGGSDHAPDRPGRPRAKAGEFPHAIPRLVPDEEATALATRFFAATGRTYGVQPFSIADGAGENRDDLAVNFLPTVRGVPYDEGWMGQVELDRETGRLDTFTFAHEPPAPPADLKPGVSADDAHRIALRAVTTGGPIEDDPRPHSALCIARLDPKLLAATNYALTPADRADAVAGRARLVYDFRFRDARAGTLYLVFVDAHDGHLLELRRRPAMPLLGAPGQVGASNARLVPPTGRRPWQVSEGGGAWSTPVSDALTPAPADGFAPTRKLHLTDGKLVFLASYDPASGRVGIEGPDGKVQVYALGPVLTARLKP